MNLPTITTAAHPLSDIEAEGRDLHDRLMAEAREALAEAIEGGDLAEVSAAV